MVRKNSLWAKQSGKYGYGKMSARRLPRPKQVNNTTCGKCGARPGQSCFVLTGTRFMELNETHFPQTGRPWREPRPAPEELANRKTSTEVLDARHSEKKRKEAEARPRVNGG